MDQTRADRSLFTVFPSAATLDQTVMAITKENKAELVKEFQTKDGDTGSPDVQIAILTRRINHLTEHMRSNKKDYSQK